MSARSTPSNCTKNEINNELSSSLAGHKNTCHRKLPKPHTNYPPPFAYRKRRRQPIVFFLPIIIIAEKKKLMVLYGRIISRKKKKKRKDCMTSVSHTHVLTSCKVIKPCSLLIFMGLRYPFYKR
ncbi:hypothetical protein CEXT_785631 [Caerostris extrusa]|uniref:Uncharacterized protein n=1 Tax=Caerostris extrusa TaxID=172846 RepID=A0AAV4MIW1_CAEEX|nr:hypothetical protein CEXT_785631 [Caerostris extrusa]